MMTWRAVAISLGASVVATTAATATSWLLLDRRLADIVVLYLLGVVIVALRFGHIASFLTAVFGVAAFDFFFTLPYFSLADLDRRYLSTYALMLFVGLVISHQTARIRSETQRARDERFRTAQLYAMSRELSSASEVEEIAGIVARHLREVFRGDVWVLLLDGSELRSAAAPPLNPMPDADLLSRAKQVLRDGVDDPADQPPAAGERVVALVALRKTLGVLIVRPSPADTLSFRGDDGLLKAFARQAAVALERAALSEEAQLAQLRILEDERLRNALLSSLSRDMRTPLAVVFGSVTAILQHDAALSPKRRREHLETIFAEAKLLNHLFRNLVDMTSLERGALRTNKQWVPLEEVIGTALCRLDEALGSRRVEITIPEDAALVPIDAILFGQVFLNLVDNAIKYTPSETPIEIRARRRETWVEVDVADRGPGIPFGEEERIFEKFCRPPDASRGGMGLGLSICRSILWLHGGTIRCENRLDGGACFRLVVPREGEPPPMVCPPPVSARAHLQLVR
jgi:two-component system sensor histidine kinase KdpD